MKFKNYAVNLLIRIIIMVIYVGIVPAVSYGICHLISSELKFTELFGITALSLYALDKADDFLDKLGLR